MTVSNLISTKDNYKSPLNIPEASSNGLSVKHKHVPAGEEITVVSMRTALMTGQRPHKAVYDFPVRYHYLTAKSQGTWMTDIPQEQVQHRDVVKKCSGHVLVGGLGLGYVVTLLAKKRSVKSITVIERSKDVIKLVWKHTDHKGKGKVVRGNLFDYLKTNKRKYDYMYFDIWQSDGERTLVDYVIPLRKLGRPFVVSDKRILCWNEDVMKGQLKLSLIGKLMLPETSKQIRTMDDKQFMRVFGDAWHTHELPFWKWFRERTTPTDIALETANKYADTFGTDAWEKQWKGYV